jgi:hypothetical protein
MLIVFLIVLIPFGCRCQTTDSPASKDLSKDTSASEVVSVPVLKDASTSGHAPASKDASISEDIPAQKDMPKQLQQDTKKSLFYIYKNADEPGEKALWLPSGWMPDGKGIAIDTNYKNGKDTCIKLTYDTEAKAWVGIYWLPEGGFSGTGHNVYKALKIKKGDPIALTFLARGKNGGENAEFKVGGADGDSLKIAISTGFIELDRNWKKFSIDLTETKVGDLSKLKGAFCWVAKKSNQPEDMSIVEIFLDEIMFTSEK